MSTNRLLRMNGFVLAIIAASFVPAAAADLVKLDAGLWEHSIRVSQDGTSWHTAEQGKTCLSAAEATSWDAEVRGQLAAAHCAVNRLSVADGGISGVISCPDINQFQVSISGQYTPRAYSIDVASSAGLDMRPVGGSKKSPIKRFAQWRGRLLGSCG